MTTTIIINEGSTLTVNDLLELEKWASNNSTTMHTVFGSSTSTSTYYDNNELIEAMASFSGEFKVPEPEDECKIFNDIPRVFHPKNNKVCKNNHIPLPNIIRRQNTSHSGWIGRKGYKKRKGK